MPATVLIVEDEPAILELIAVNLEHAGFETLRAKSAEEAGRLLGDILPDLVLLDWMLPGQSGLSLARRLRGDGRTKEMPLIFLTARADEPDKLAGLEAGADDYITKPFSTQELAARVAAQLRRASARRHSPVSISADGLSIDVRLRQVKRGSVPVRLTRIEWEILAVLVSDPGRVFTHQQLFTAVWKRPFGDARLYLRVHVTNLRRKIERDPADPRCIITEPGVGYRFFADS
jgi:two-component system phosphate regulon response regulator PhoB